MKTLFERVSANADELRIVRVKNTVELAADASFSEILIYKRILLKMINDLEQSLDLGETSTTDIASNLKNFDPCDWAEKLHENIGNIFERVEKLNCRIKIHNCLFPDKLIELITPDSFGEIVSLMLNNKND